MRDGDRLRPVDNNSWEGCGMKISEQAVIEMMKYRFDVSMMTQLGMEANGWSGAFHWSSSASLTAPWCNWSPSMAVNAADEPMIPITNYKS
jgi:hypothetical protein